MTHMSYVMFENTLQDMRLCWNKLEEINFDLTELSESEQQAATKLIAWCKVIAKEFE
jgi:hypothetical protein